VSHGVLWLLIAVAVVVLATATVGLVRVRRRRSIESGRPPTLEAAPEPAPVTAPPVPPSATTSVDAEAVDAPRAVAPEVAAPAALSVRLGSARSLFDRVRALRGRTAIGTDELAEVEAALLRADVGTATTASILEAITTAAADRTLGDDGVTGALRRELLAVLGPAPAPLSAKVDADRVAVWLFVGVNGVGKTTTIGKVAAMESKEIAVLLAAGDTFRAAAADQLAMWAERTGTDIVRGAEGGDPSAVLFDAVQRAAARGNDLVLADTAGRLHTKVNLVEELKKIRRVAGREPGNVTEVLLVLDATTGQNALVQARQFTEAVEVTGIVLTKLDGTAKGGIVVAVQRDLGIPVKLVGLGEGPDDLVDFDPDEFVDALLATD
jgi:fused signal recognition particle receptor